MGRIDEALRRALGADGKSAATREQREVFESAWDTDAGLTDRVGTIEPPVRPQEVPRIDRSDRDQLLVKATGQLPTLSTRLKERFACSDESDPALVEQFRRLAATLHNAQLANGLRTILISSTLPGEGKTLSAINLALVLSQSYGRRVLLIDADLRRPSISDVAEVTGSVGLSAGLKAKADQKLATIPLNSTLMLLPAGPPDPDPLSGLTSPRMRRILDEAASRFDWVILDGPPVGLLADVNVLTRMVEGTLFVIRSGHTQHPLVQKAIEQIGRERLLGVILNGVSRKGFERYGSYYVDGSVTGSTPGVKRV